RLSQGQGLSGEVRARSLRPLGGASGCPAVVVARQAQLFPPPGHRDLSPYVAPEESANDLTSGLGSSMRACNLSSRDVPFS
ncbi:MAG: hypothetical protein OEW13_09065, partial [Nitrospira sp.]|nr:hypothetical protein [Nitrospira sp.]